MAIEEKILSTIKNAFSELYGADIADDQLVLQPTRKEFEGNYTFVCFPFLRYSRKDPEETGGEIGKFLKENAGELIRDFNTVKGFLNLSINDDTWSGSLQALVDGELNNEANGVEVMVEYASPNTNKPIHLGHMRNILLGWSVSEILRANGNSVHRVQIINDRGIHICKSMVAWDHFGNGKSPKEMDAKGDKFVGDYYVQFEKQYRKEIKELVAGGSSEDEAKKKAPIFREAQDMLIKWEERDTEVVEKWKTMNSWVYEGWDVTFDTMGVVFDKIYYESETYLLGRDVVLKGVEDGIFFRKEDGSVWVDLTADGLDEKLLLRSDGTSVYMTQDIGTAILRFRDFPKISRQVYTVGNEQEYHFKVLFLILDKLGYKWAKECYHLSYGMVDLPSGKMKSREGTVVDADDLMQDVIDKAKERTLELGKVDEMPEKEAEELFRKLGLGALKYYLLRVDPRKRILFNPDESVDLQGNTGPFIQYTHARINSLLRKASSLGIDWSTVLDVGELTDFERDLVHMLSDYRNRLEEAARDYSPSVIASYTYDLAKEYNKLWQNVVILKEEDETSRNFRLALSGQVARTIAKCLELLGIEAPERM